MSRTLLYGADGTPAVVDLGPQERMEGALIEIFGMMIQYQGPAPRPLTETETLNMIVSIVGIPKLEERWAGIELKATPRRES